MCDLLFKCEYRGWCSNRIFMASISLMPLGFALFFLSFYCIVISHLCMILKFTLLILGLAEIMDMIFSFPTYRI